MLLAGRALTVGAVRNDSNSDHHSDPASKTYSKAIHNNQSIVGSNIGAAGALALAAGMGETGSLDITASSVASGGALGLSASGDIHIGAAQESHLADTASKSSSSSFLKKSSISMADHQASTLAIGSSLAGDTVTLNARNDIVIGASAVTAQGALALSAGRDLTVTTATASHSESHFLETKKSGITLGLAHGIGYLNAADRADGSSDATSAVGSVLSGGSVMAISGRDTLIQGSTVLADRDLTLLASRDLSIVSAQDTLREQSASSSKRSGMIGSIGQPAVGSAKSSQDGSSASVTQVASQVVSLGGNVTLRAGEQYRQTASQVLAPGGDIDIAAKNVLIDAAFNTSDSTQHSAASRTAIGGSASIPVVSSVQGMIGMAKAAKDTSSGRMQGLAAITAAMQAQDAVNGVANVADTMKNGTGIKISVSLGTSKSESTARQSASTALGSKIAAAGNVHIAASGAGKDSNLTAIGSDISAGGHVDLQADNAIALLAAHNTASQHSNNSSSGFNVGVGFAFGGAQHGFTLDVSANKGRGRADGDDISYSNTHVSAGGDVNLRSGGDTTLKGAVINGNTVRADVKGNLSIESLQDSSTYTSKQSSGGFGLSVCLPPFCYGASSASLSVSKAKVNGDFLSVTEQSGIKSGDGGFQIKVGGNTDLTGAVISSGQSAVQGGLNSLDTGSLSFRQLVNQDVYQASGYSLSATVSGNLGNQPAPAPVNKEDAKKAADAAGPKPNASGGFGSASGSQHSITQSGISGGALHVGDGGSLTGIKRDVTSENADAQSGTLAKAWNGQQLMKEVQAQMTITQAFSAQAPKAIANLADSQSKDLLAKAALAPSGSAEEKALKDEAARWDEGGAYRTALHAVSGALLGGIGGAAGAATIASAADRLNTLQAHTRSALEAQGMSAGAAEMLAQGLAQATSIGIGAAVGGSAGAAAALATDTNNRQLHPIETKWIKDNARRYALQQGISPAEAEKRLADQAFREVQFGAAGETDAAARAFLKNNNIGQLLPGDVTIPGQNAGYMFSATPDQKVNANMYLNALLASPQAVSFYQSNHITQPNLQQIVNAARLDGAQRADVLNKTVAAAATAGALVISPAFAGVAVELAAFGRNPVGYCLNNPSGCAVAAEAVVCIAAGPACSPSSLMPAIGGATRLAQQEAGDAAKAASAVVNAGRANGASSSVAAGVPYREIVGQVPGRVLSESDALMVGPLGNDLTDLPGTFSGGRYATLQLNQPMTVYRAWAPGQSREFGAFWSLEKPAGSIQTRIDSALLPEWGNIRGTRFNTQATQYTTIQLPAGTTVHVGEVGSQGGSWVGGKSQLLIDGGAQPEWKISESPLK